MATASPDSPDLILLPAATGATPACSRAPGRTSRGPSTNPEGPVIYALLLGLPDGRWSESLNSKHRSCEALQRLVKEPFLSAGLQDYYCATCVPAMSSASGSVSGPTGPTVVGITRMSSWSTTAVMSTSGHDALAAAMKAALRLKHRRSNSIQFLYHRFWKVAYFDSPKQVPAMRPDRPQTSNLADAMKAIGGSWITDSGTGARYSDIAALLHEWGCPSTGTIHTWAATHVMTSVIARGLIPFDMTAVVPRSCDGHDDWLCSVHPPRRIMQELRRMVVDFAVTDVDFGSTRSAMEPEPQPTTKYRARGPDKLQRKYRTEHLVNGLRMSINFKSQRPLKRSFMPVLGICTHVISNAL